MAFPFELDMTDGTVSIFSFHFGAHEREFFLQSTAGIADEYTFAVSYDTPGDYSPAFRSVGELALGVPAPELIRHAGYSIFGETSVSVVPSPIVGAGLPGLVLALGSGLAWWRRRRNSG